ncbi:MAG: aspartate-semialdehyde dehydrogenase [Alphaproteobacteria bacterium]
MSYRIAVAGATGNVGRELLLLLEERNFPVSEIIPLASARSAGKKIEYKDTQLVCQDLATFDFSEVDIVLSSPGGAISKEYSPIAAKAGAIVIDNTSVWRMDDDVPLVVPEVNPQDLKNIKKGIVANPNCSTIQMLVALKPLHDVAKIKRVVVSTYQATSGGGKDAMDELFNQTAGIYKNDAVNPKVFTKQIAFNCIPHIDVFMDDGYTKEEWKMRVETKKILDANIEVSATAVRVPVFTGHAEAITVEFEGKMNEDIARKAFKNAEGLTLIDNRENGGYVTQFESTGNDDVYISRLRNDTSKENSITFWCVSDNVRKGAALNTIQIAEKMIEMDII